MSFFSIYNEKTTKPKRTFEECYPEIEREVDKRKYKWRLDAINGWCSWEDIKYIILFHVWSKFHLYQQDRPLSHWIQRICSNQIINQLRNHYFNYQKPCVRCPCAEGDDLCSVYGNQTNSCPLIAKWEKSKKQAYNVKLPLYLENHLNEYYDRPDKDYDVERTAPLLHEKMEEVLKPLDFRVYKILYIENKTEEQAMKALGYKDTDAGRTAASKSIKESKKVIMATARSIIANNEIDLL